MTIRSLVALAWPAAFALSVLPVALVVTAGSGHGRQARIGIAVCCTGLLATLFAVPPLNAAVRWGLTLVGFGAPIAVSVIAIRYIVDET